MSAVGPVRADDDRLAAERDALIASLPLRETIHLPTDRIPLPEQVEGLRQVSRLYKFGMEEHAERMQLLKAEYEGVKRAFILGTGPSLNNVDLSKLKGEVTFSVGAFYLKQKELDWAPTFHLVEDHLLAEDRAAELNSLKTSIRLFPAYLRYCLAPSDHTVYLNHRPQTQYADGIDFSKDADRVTYGGASSVYTCLQVAYFLGIEKVYLLGVDAEFVLPEDVEVKAASALPILDMKSDDQNHFHKDYVGKGFRWHPPMLKDMLGGFREARRVFEADGRRIYNATPGGKLEVFRRIDYRTLFASPPPVPDEAADKPAADLGPKFVSIDIAPSDGRIGPAPVNLRLVHKVDRAQVLEVYAQDGGIVSRLSGEVVLHRDVSSLLKRIKSFGAEAILYRPHPDDAPYGKIAHEAVAQSALPLVTWISARAAQALAQGDAGASGEFEEAVGAAVHAAVRNVCDNEELARQLEDRFGKPFADLPPATDPTLWERPGLPFVKEKVLIRCAAASAPAGATDTLLAIARVIELLSDTVDAEFEIFAGANARLVADARFKAFSRVRIIESFGTPTDYRNWLTGADAAVLAAPWPDQEPVGSAPVLDPAIADVVQSGALILAIGGKESASLRLLNGVAGVQVLSDPTNLLQDLKGVLSDPVQARAKARMARAAGEKLFDLKDRSERFSLILKNAREAAPRKGGRKAFRKLEIVTSAASAKATEDAPSEASEPQAARAATAEPAKASQPTEDPKMAATRRRMTAMLKRPPKWARRIVAAGAIGFAALPAILHGTAIERAGDFGPAIGLILAFVVLWRRPITDKRDAR